MAKPDSREMDAVSVTRRARAVELRITGHTYQDIGGLMGITRQGAHELVRHELSNMVDVTREQIAGERQLEVARIEVMVKKIWPRAFPDDGSIDYDGVRSLLRCMERKQKLLGLEAPQKHTVDMGHLQGQAALMVEMITRVIPDDSVPKVYEAMEAAMILIQKREAVVIPGEVA